LHQIQLIDAKRHFEQSRKITLKKATCISDRVQHCGWSVCWI